MATYQISRLAYEGVAKESEGVTADKIATAHGCEILPAGNGLPAIVVAAYYRQGGPRDDARVAECRAALRQAGIDESDWLS